LAKPAELAIAQAFRAFVRVGRRVANLLHLALLLLHFYLQPCYALTLLLPVHYQLQQENDKLEEGNSELFAALKTNASSDMLSVIDQLQSENMALKYSLYREIQLAMRTIGAVTSSGANLPHPFQQASTRMSHHSQ